MRSFALKTRYYYWFFSSFIRKYGRIIIPVFIGVFLLFILFRSFGERLLFNINFTKKRIGLVVSGDRSRLPPEILPLISSSLTTFDEKGRIGPKLASSWESKLDGKEFIFRFQKDLVWSDGLPFTTADLDRSLLSFNGMVVVKPIDPYTVSFTLQQKLANFPSLLTTPVLKNNFIGIQGTYKVGHIKVEFGEIRQVDLTPLVSGLSPLVYKLYETNDEVVLAYRMAEIDSFTTQDARTAHLFDQWRNTDISSHFDFYRIVTLFINTQKAPFDNKNLRQALAYGVNYSKFDTFGQRAHSPILPFSFAYNEGIKTYVFEPEIAKSLVEKNNATGKKITMYASYELNELVDELTKSFKEIGLIVDARYTSYIPTNYDMFLTVWEPTIDPDQYIFWHQTQKTGNISNVKNVRIDKLLEDGRKELSQTKRKQIYAKFQELIAEEVPAVFLYYPKLYTISRK